MTDMIDNKMKGGNATYANSQGVGVY